MAATKSLSKHCEHYEQGEQGEQGELSELSELSERNQWQSPNNMKNVGRASSEAEAQPPSCRAEPRHSHVMSSGAETQPRHVERSHATAHPTNSKTNLITLNTLPLPPQPTTFHLWKSKRKSAKR